MTHRNAGRPLVAAALLLAAACGNRPATAPAAPSAAARPEHANRVTLSEEAVRNLEVTVEALSPTRHGPRIEVPATIVADAQQVAQVGARVAGRVVALRVAVGDRVEVGAPLVEVDAVELHQVTMEYLVALARVRQAGDVATRARAMSQERIGSTAELRRAEAEATAARATLHEAEEHLHFLGLGDRDISRIRAATSHGQTRSVVRAPIAGTVASLTAAVGQVLAGTETVAVVGRIDRVWASLRLYERDLPQVRAGARVELQLPGSPNAERVEGTLSFVSEVLDAESRTAEGRVMLENPQGRMRPNMSARAWVSLPVDEARLWLPREAVQSHDGAQVVFVEVAERTFEARPVQIGDEVGGYVPVREGVEAGVRVVLRAAFSLRAELEHGELEEEE